MARKCLREMREKWSRSAKDWEEERKEFFESRGMEIKEMEKKRQSRNN